MVRSTMLAFAIVSTVFAARADGDYQDPTILGRACFALAPGETLGLAATKDQALEYMKISKALGKLPTLKVKEARLQTFRYHGNPGDTAILAFELDNGLKFEAAADQIDSKSPDFTIVDDGGGYSVVASGANRIVLLDARPARIDILATPDQLQEIESKAGIVFEGGTGSLTVKQGQSALFVSAPCGP